MPFLEMAYNQDLNMSYKVEYITKLLQKTSTIAIENYCLTRLWHKLDNDEIKVVPQQYVARNFDKWPLTGIYFPQFKIHIGVNEPSHYNFVERIQADEERKKEIENNKNHKLFVIDCRHELSKIHQQIDEIIVTINKAHFEQIANGIFKPWQPDIDRNPDFWRSKIAISESDDISFSSAEDICKLFQADFHKTKGICLAQGGLFHPKNSNYLIWWPSEKSKQGWLINLSEDEEEIIETHSDEEKKAKYFNEHQNTSQKRIVFFLFKDFLGLTNYNFKGVYSYDDSKSNQSIGTVWKRDSKNVNLLKLSD